MSLPQLFALFAALCAVVAGVTHRGGVTGLGDPFIWVVVGLAFASLAHLVYGKVGR